MSNSKVDVEKLLQENNKFLSRLSAKFAGRISFEEFYQAGALGLIEAAQKYDPSKGVKFLSFASRFIYYRMIEVLRLLYYPVRIPMYRNKVLNRIRKTGGLTTEERRELGLSKSEAEYFVAFADPPSRFSLDSNPGRACSGLRFDGEEVYYKKTLASQISDYVWNSPVFDDRERLVLFCYFGLGGHPRSSLHEIYKRYSDLFLSTSQVRRFFKSGKKKLERWLDGKDSGSVQR